MIRYVRNREIERMKWDECITGSVNGLIYARSWYLDRVSPGWDALVEDDYDSVFPLTHSRRFGIRYLYQPYFTQQLGVFSKHHLTEELVGRFLEAIPARFRFAEIHLNVMNKVNAEKFNCTPRVNLELDLINLYENLTRNFDQNTRRNIRKAMGKDLVIRRKVDPDELVTLFRENYGGREGKLKFLHYEIIRQLMEDALVKTFSMTMGVYLPDQTICAGAFFLKESTRVIFLFAASDPRARENGAMFFLLDNFIRDHAGQSLTLDFEGSNDPDVARFYRGFGARECRYQLVRINRFSPLMNKAVSLIRNFRS